MSKRGENIYKRKDGRWEGRIINEDGKYKYFYGKSYNEVRKKKNSWFKDSTQQPLSIKSSYFLEILESWLKDCYGNVKNSTYESYYYCMKKYIFPYFREHPTDKVTETCTKDFMFHIYSNTLLSRAYQKKILQVLRTAVKYVLSKNQDLKAILNALKLPNIENVSNFVEVFSIYEQSRIEEELNKTKSNKDIGLFICFYTGIRLGELCALQWVDLDMDSKMLKINKTLIRTRNFEEAEQKTRLAISTPKSHHSIRKIPLPEFLFDNLNNLLMQSNSKDHYILSNSSVPVEPRTIQRYYERILGNLEISYRKFHAIRHTFVTRALEVGIDIRTLSEILGHSNVTTTLNTYAHSLLEQKKLAISKLNTLHTTQMISALYTVNKAVNK